MLFTLSKDATGKPDMAAARLSSLAEAGWSEKDLEDLLASRIQDIMREDKLLVIFQERRAREEPDLLALDRDGVLYIFELKSWMSDQSNLLQVIRYGQIFGQYDYSKLDELWRKYCPKDDRMLEEAHREHFVLDRCLEKSRFNTEQKFVVMTAGADYRTLRAIEYWKSKNLPIFALTYHVYEHAGVHFLEIHAFSPDPEDYAALERGAYVVNTPVKWDAKASLHMLNNDRVSAFYDRKTRINHIQKGDQVVLYYSGLGAIAYGRAQGNVRVGDYDSPGEEHYVPVKWEVKINPFEEPSKSVSASEINAQFGTKRSFRLTCETISKEMASFIEKRLKQNKEQSV